MYGVRWPSALIYSCWRVAQSWICAYQVLKKSGYRVCALWVSAMYMYIYILRLIVQLTPHEPYYNAYNYTVTQAVYAHVQLTLGLSLASWNQTSSPLHFDKICAGWSSYARRTEQCGDQTVHIKVWSIYGAIIALICVQLHVDKLVLYIHVNCSSRLYISDCMWRMPPTTVLIR